MGSIKMVTPAALAVLVVGLAACGSSGKTASGSAGLKIVSGVQTPLTQAQTGGKRGGTLVVLDHEDFEHLDAGSAYFSLDYEVLDVVQRPLYSYKPNTFSTPTPDIASGPAQISPDGKTLTIHIRHGVHFSPPVNREVTSADVAYAIERDANPNVANSYFHSYFSAIVGAEKANGGPISGVSTPDKYTIVFKLSESKAQIVLDALVLPGSAPVPVEYARKYDAKKPSEYANYQVATGPYMFKADGSGKVLGVGYQPGKSATLVRNPNWNASTDFRPAYVDRIEVHIGGDPTVIGRQVLEGSGMVQNDSPAQPIVKLAYQKYRSQLEISPGAGDHYIAVDNKEGPFSNVNVRRAYWAALNRVAMNKARGGELVTNTMTHFLYPEIPGFEEAGGVAGPRVDYNEHPEGNLQVAEKYMRLAGYPSGKYTGSKTLQVVGATGSPEGEVAEIANQTLKSLGFKTKFNLVDKSVMFGKFCAVPAEKVDVCPNVGWLADFGDGQAVLDVPFNGNHIEPSNNSNFGQVNVPQINKAMAVAELTVGAKARAAAWASIDRELVANAVAIPYDWEKQPDIESKNVAGVGDLWNLGSWDYAFTSLK
ncbi:MAG TPA: ABC transporter substrate-binding protein [Solirubrobacteraceae bacterium]